VAENAYKQYLKSRPGASVESVKRTKELKALPVGDHPLLCQTNTTTSLETDRASILEQMKNFRPKSTIFEVGNTTKNKEVIEVMSIKRKKHGGIIEQQHSKKIRLEDREEKSTLGMVGKMEKSSEEDIAHTFETVVRESGPKSKVFGAKKKVRAERDQNFIPYEPSDKHTEAGYNLNDGFSSQVR
jgi:ATP-dependent RNA helicase DDX54/DBP10